MVLAMRGLIIALLGLLAISCGGYAELPVQIRETAALTVEEVTLFPGATGTIQFTIVAPEDVTGPLWVVGGPEIIAPDPRIRAGGWAHGPCHSWSPAPTLPDAAIRLCLTLYTPAGAPPEGVVLGAVVDARAQARRFSAIGEVMAP